MNMAADREGELRRFMKCLLHTTDSAKNRYDAYSAQPSFAHVAYETGFDPRRYILTPRGKV